MFRRDFIKEILLSKNESSKTVLGWSSEYYQQMSNMVSSDNILHGISQLELLNFAGERLLVDMDMTSMASSLEVRVPFLDHEFIEALAGYNQHYRFYPIQRKSLLKKLLWKGLMSSCLIGRRRGLNFQ